MFEVMALMARHVPSFFVTANRFSELVEPQISTAIKQLAPSDMLLVLLVKAAATLMVNLKGGLESAQGEQKTESSDNLLEMVQGLIRVLSDKVDGQIADHANNFDAKIELMRLNEIKAVINPSSETTPSQTQTEH